MAALAVGREGLETALFFFTAAQAAGETTQPLIGFLIGIAIAIALAYLIYRGALRINLGKFFTVTGFLLIFVAAGILAYGVHDLQEAAILPGLNTLAFDVSAAVPPDSWYGTLLKGVFNFSPQTTVLEAIVWVAYVAVVLTLFLRPADGRRAASRLHRQLDQRGLTTAVPRGAPACPAADPPSHSAPSRLGRGRSAGCASTAPSTAPSPGRRGRRRADHGERHRLRLRGLDDRRRRPGTSPSRSPTPARRSPSSTSTARATGSWARSRTSAPA